MIAIFDSGLGGLTALRETAKMLPGRDIIYFGDTGRVPYGTRSRAIIIKYALQDVRFLMSAGRGATGMKIEAVLAACGTVSSAALGAVRAEFDVPVFGVIEGAARKAAALTKNKTVGIFATPAAISNGAYQGALAGIDPGIKTVGVPWPLLGAPVECGYINRDNPVTRLVLSDYLRAVRESGADTLILGCTHYPLISGAISDLIPGVELVNSGAEAAVSLAESLNGTHPARGESGRISYYVSDNPEGFRGVASIFFGGCFEGEINVVDIENY